MAQEWILVHSSPASHVVQRTFTLGKWVGHRYKSLRQHDESSTHLNLQEYSFIATQLHSSKMTSFLTKFYVSAILVMVTFISGMAVAAPDEEVEGMRYIYLWDVPLTCV